jgi:hypothetical protein
MRRGTFWLANPLTNGARPDWFLCRVSHNHRCRLTPSFAEFRQMLLVDPIDPGLHVGMSGASSGRRAHQSSRAKPFKQDFLRRALGQGIRQCRQRFFEWVIPTLRLGDSRGIPESPVT